MPIDRDDHPLRRQAEAAAHRVDDPQVGLVRHQPIDVAPGQPVRRQRLVHRLGQTDDRVAEHLATVHHQMAGTVGPTDGAINVEDVAEIALGVQMGGQDAAVDGAACPRRPAGTRRRRRRRTAHRCRDPAS